MMKTEIKTTLKRITYCMAVTALTLILLLKAGDILTPYTLDMDKIRSFHDMPKNSFDVIGYGSSHMLAAMDPGIMRDEYGISAYNYGAEWQQMDTTELFVRDSLKTQSPRIAVIETYFAPFFYEHGSLDGETLYTREVHVNKLGYLKGRFADRFGYASYFLPVLAFHDQWPAISKASFSRESLADAFSESLGQFRVETVEVTAVPSYSELPQEELSEEAIERLDRIVDICRDHDAEVLFITAPLNDMYAYTDSMARYADSRGYAYIDFFERMEETGIDPSADFYDGAHLNVNGAAKLSRYLSEYILTNYNLDSDR